MPDPVPVPAPAPEEQVHVYDPNTSTYGTVAASELGQAINAGMVPESPQDRAARLEREQYDTLGEGALAGVEGLARGATVGMSDVAAQKLGLDTEAMERRQRLFPVTSTGADIAGSLAGLGKFGEAKGALGLLGRGAEVASAPARGLMKAGFEAESLAHHALHAGAETLGLGHGLLTKAAIQAGAFGVGGAVEGGIMGAGQALSEAALSGGDYDGLAEKMLAGAKHGAIFGGTSGSIMGGTLGLAAGVGEKAAAGLKKLATIDEPAANERALAALGARGTDLRALGSTEKIQKIGQDLRTGTLADGTPIIEAFDNAENIAAKVEKAKDEAVTELANIRKQVIKDSDGIDARAYLDKVDQEVIAPLRESPSPTIRRKADMVDAELADLRTRSGHFEAGQQGAFDTAKKIEKEIVAPMLSSKSAAIRAKAEELQAHLRNFADLAESGKATRDLTNGLAEDVLTPLLAAPSAAVRRNAKKAFIDVRRAADEIVAPVTYQDLLNQQRALKEVVYPKKAPGQGLPSAVPEHAEALARSERILEDTLSEHVEKTLQRTAPQEAGRYAELRSKAESFIKADKIAQKATKQNLGNRLISPSDYGVGGAMAMGQLAAGHILAPIEGAATSLLHHQIRTRGNSVLVALSNRAAATDLGISKAVRKFLHAGSDVSLHKAAEAFTAASTAEHLGGSSGSSKQEAFDKLRDKLERAEAPEHFGINEHAPQTDSAARGVLNRAIQFLRSKLPLMGAGAPTPLQGKLEPHPSEIDKFARYYHAVNKPMEVVEDFAHGTLTHESAEALRECWPSIYAQLQTATMAALAKQPGTMPYHKRVVLGTLLQIPTDRSLQPSAIRSAQQVLTAQNQPPKQTEMPQTNTPISQSVHSYADQLTSQELAI